MLDNDGVAIRDQSARIRNFAIRHVHKDGLAALVASRYEITRQAAHAHLQALVQQGVLVAEGRTRTRTYKLATIAAVDFRYQIVDGLAEDVVWRRDIQPYLADLPANVLAIWNYAFTEMFNNAIDHSAGSLIFVDIKRSVLETELIVRDDGIGIFQKIQAAFDLPDEKQAIFELSKGKLTTDVANHSGQGIFFTSRLVNAFDIWSGGVYFSHELGRKTDWMMDAVVANAGTSVFLRVSNNTTRTIKKVYDQFSVAGSFSFDKTTVPVRLAKYGTDQLISRSQAKRVLLRVEQFSQVVFDFTDIDLIGQAFADQIFRVFALEHPTVDLKIVHATTGIEGLINAVRKTIRPGYKGSLELFPSEPST